MMEITHDGKNYVCAFCRRNVRMLPRNKEEFARGRKELWIHHDDRTPACPHEGYLSTAMTDKETSDA